VRLALHADGTVRQEEKGLLRNGVIQGLRVVYQLADGHRRVRMRLVVVLEAVEQLRQPKTEAVVPGRVRKGNPSFRKVDWHHEAKWLVLLLITEREKIVGSPEHVCKVDGPQQKGVLQERRRRDGAQLPPDVLQQVRQHIGRGRRCLVLLHFEYGIGEDFLHLTEKRGFHSEINIDYRGFIG